MSGQIRMSPERMRDCCARLRREGDAFESSISSMQATVNEICAEWEGLSSAQYAQQFEEAKPVLINLRQMIETMGVQLTQTAEAMESLDQSIASQIGF